MSSEESVREIFSLPQSDVGAPLPQVFSSGWKTFLIYMISEPDPEWDGSYVNVIDNKSNTDYPIAIVEFIHPQSHRFGIVNDEAINGHPLYLKGLRPYSAHIIENSSWINEIKQIHKVHRYFREEKWTKLNHFFLFFHDEVFEVIAEDFKVEITKQNFKDIGFEVVKRMNS